MRDYLERVYGVGVISVRSYIEAKPISRMTRDGRNIGAWRRPAPEKRMTVELRDPFVWPEEPKDLSPYVILQLYNCRSHRSENPFKCLACSFANMSLLKCRWEKESWDSSERFQSEMRKRSVQKLDASEEPDEKLRKAFKEQASQLKENSQAWRPTWQVLGLDFAHREFTRSKRSSSAVPKWMKP